MIQCFTQVLLAKIRRHRLNEDANITVDDINTEMIKQCVEMGIINGTGFSIDSTHTEANTLKAIPERVMNAKPKNL